MASDERVTDGHSHIKNLTKDYEGYCIDLMRMTFNYRIVRSTTECYWYDMYFCYPADKVDLEDVILWAYQWSGIDGSVPDGPWVKGWAIGQDGKGREVRQYGEEIHTNDNRDNREGETGAGTEGAERTS